MKIQLSALGRILFALPFGILGLSHFFMLDFYLSMVSSLIPGMGFSILLVGIILVVASICIIIDKLVKWACWVVAFLLFLFIITIHIPGLLDPQKATIAIIELMKDTGLMGGALFIAGLKNE